MSDIRCAACGEIYTHTTPCACSWRRRHYRQIAELRRLERQGATGPERYALITAIKSDGDPVIRMLENAPLDDEPCTADDRRALDEGWAAYLAGLVPIPSRARRNASAV